ncbi:D-alanyl-D-alanine carboxypeptidase family protein [Cohnella sp. CFH 77786]|uniref:M15 family metallopeptidase n=1 Tax=Cohnella sp. CFH 77786 TaxID=2662265 RepID=UPI001C60840E|nr:M15 family metallopeptidase [Cohnella sp. CFH 77786]MBW5447325.1 D-alanyl-D-alanine carboxypeptidase family protein [Cohnella sp. CFH 77786]
MKSNINRVKWLAALAAALIAGGLVIHAAGDRGQTKPTDQQASNTQKPPETQKPTEQPSSPEASENQPDMPSWAMDNLLERTIRASGDGLAVVTNPSSIYVLVNKSRNLPSSYIPNDLVVPNVAFSFSGDSPKKKMRKEAATALEELFEGAGKAGIKLKAVSGYRSYATQKALFENYSKKHGEDAANRFSAHPGQSEHQTGLAMDISSASAGYDLVESFGETEEGRWLAAHAAEYGFIIRYPKGKEKITGYQYEPWHVRYIGKEAAADVVRSKLTFEEFFGALEASAAK